MKNWINRKKYNLLGLLGILLFIVGFYAMFARPYQLSLGATEQEINRPMPGDELDPDPGFLATRAITIQGTPQEIWPWLIQMGYDRAGFYGYDLLENLGSAQGIRSADQILPEFQDFEVGDEVPISAVASLSFYAIEPDQYLIWEGNAEDDPGGFAWVLYPIDNEQTRLVSRIRWSYEWDQPELIAFAPFTELTDHIAVRKILQGVKGRVEGQIEPMAIQNVEFFLLLTGFFQFLASLTMLLVRPFHWRRFLASLAAGIVWLIAWYAPITFWQSAIIQAVMILFLVRVFRPTAEGLP
jgi:hypothetical protein